MRKLPFLWPALLAVGVFAVAGQAVETDPLPKLDTPYAVYTASCAACHGDDGAGQPQERLGFDVSPPDFNECTFATREPDPDWFAVAHEGGPVRGFDHRMPAFGEALSDRQIELAVEHIRTFCSEPEWPSGDINQPRPMFTEKAFVEDEFIFTFGAAVEKPYSIEGELLYETRFGARNQLEVIVPFGALDLEAPEDNPEGGGWTSGIGDIAIGIKRVFGASKNTGSIVSGIAELVMPTGDPDKDLGKGAFVFEPSLAYGQSLGPAGFVHLQAGAELPMEEDPEMEAFWRLVYGYTFTQGRFGRAWTPMLEVLGKMELAEGAEPEWDLAPQVQISLNTRQHMALGLAARIPVEPDNDRPIGVWAYFLWEWFDGGLGEGW